jgi:hypothetical protein
VAGEPIGGRPPPRPKTKNFQILFWPLGVVEQPPTAMGWLRPPQTGRFGVAEATPWLNMVAGHPLWGGRLCGWLD